ncbi:MAG: hypothetical protein Q9215_002794 [Flavoplaca cf. flavocitrina]
MPTGTFPSSTLQSHSYAHDLTAQKMVKHQTSEERSNYLGRIPWLNRGRSHDEDAATSVAPEKEGSLILEKERQSHKMQEPSQVFHPANTIPDSDHDGQEKGDGPGNGTNTVLAPSATASDDTTQDSETKRREKAIPHASSQPGQNQHLKQSEQTDPHLYSLANQLRATVFNSWLNVLLIFSPIGIALNYANVTPIAVFIINLVAIIPLAGMLSYSSEEIALRAGETLGGLVHASFGNAVELIVSIIALVHNEIDIVRESLIGSILSNLLLVFGMSVFFGGVTRVKQYFNVKVAQIASCLLALASGSLVIPAAFLTWAEGRSDAEESPDVTALSRGVSILLLLVYGCFLFFQLKTHAEIYKTPSQKVPKRSETRRINSVKASEAMAMNSPPPFQGRPTDSVEQPNTTAASAPEAAEQREMNEMEKAETEIPKLRKWVAVLTLVTSTALVALCAEAMVGSIDSITEGGAISRTFVGLILLPIVGNAAEHSAAVRVAIKDKMDLSIGICLGSSMQISLLIIPFIVVLGWILGKGEMNLAFDGFQVIALFLAVILVNYLIQDGESHW